VRINELSFEESLKVLRTTPQGLTDEEVQRRLRQFGYNEIKEPRKFSLLKKLPNQFFHFLALILWIGAFLAFLADYLHPGEGMKTLGFAIIMVISINALFAFVQEYKAEKTLEKLMLLLPHSTKVIREGRDRECHIRELVPGDIIYLYEGDKVPADARVIEAHALSIDKAHLTGESNPIFLTTEPFQGELFKSPNIAFAGSTVLSGWGKAVVFATGPQTEFGRIARLTETVKIEKTPLQKEIAKTSRLIALFATSVGLIFFIIGHFLGKNFWENFTFLIGVIVALVPEGLLPTVTLSLAMASQRMLKKKALIKVLSAVEGLGAVQVICTDKTGTLTQNKMEVKDFWIFDEEAFPMLLKISFLCNNTKELEGELKGDPTEIALYKFAKGYLGDFFSERLSEIPFDPIRKRMTTQNRLEAGIFYLTKGATEGLLPLCTHALISGKKVYMDEEIRKIIWEEYEALMEKGLRVLAFAYSEVEPEKDMTFVGLIGLEDPPRPEVKEAISKCKEAGIRIILITGDASKTALAIAREIGLASNPVIIEGEEFHKLSDQELKKKLKEKEILFTRMAPKDKLRIVSLLQDLGERVAVTGDGVNDAPAIKKADIGIAMGSGTEVAKEASSIVLLDDNFATIINAIEEGRAVYENIKKFLAYFLTSNVAELVPYLVYAIYGIPLPLTIMQILAIDLGTDILPGLALGVERPTGEELKRPPRSPKERLFSLPLILRVCLFLAPFEILAGLFGYFYVLDRGGWHWGMMLDPMNILYRQATTACLTGIVLSQVGNVMACRTFKTPVLKICLFSNYFLLAGILIEILLQLFIVYHPLGQKIFSTSALSPHIWLILLPFPLALFISEEIRKFILSFKKT
jgi:sodium/potassium-transporting ATPase subunit alpha